MRRDMNGRDQDLAIGAQILSGMYINPGSATATAYEYRPIRLLIILKFFFKNYINEIFSWNFIVGHTTKLVPSFYHNLFLRW